MKAKILIFLFFSSSAPPAFILLLPIQISVAGERSVVWAKITTKSARSSLMKMDGQQESVGVIVLIQTTMNLAAISLVNIGRRLVKSNTLVDTGELNRMHIHHSMNWDNQDVVGMMMENTTQKVVKQNTQTVLHVVIIQQIVLRAVNQTVIHGY